MKKNFTPQELSEVIIPDWFNPEWNGDGTSKEIKVDADKLCNVIFRAYMIGREHEMAGVELLSMKRKK